ncbi:MAG: tetratricopeptide repeat protein [Allosphingosinicella sp.]
MSLTGLILATAAATTVPLSDHVEISPAVQRVAGPHGIKLPPDAVRELEKLEAAGDRTASALLGEYYMVTSPQDWARACDYHEKAGRHASGLHNLATCHFLGNGRPRDLAKARTLYEQASDLGFAKAACAFGNMLIAGQGGDKDAARGLDLCRRAADMGEPDAQTDYGGYLLTGREMPKNAVLARRYLAGAAAKRHVNASYLLGQIYWNGDGVERDRAEAARWWKVAHEAGRPEAAFMIGIEATTRIADARKANRSIPAEALNDAETWLKIAETREPNPAKRREAAELLQAVAALARGQR